ncbi:MAG: hypothetical protein JNN06_07550 [Gemmobacter sp.]|uniref:hypothetical protein n=1 Tax=Gemmobacter sp. TaxID=1898957 RepID=UPI001A606FB4|nr:hypothetical protein [Gemmobacter sp.]MBL8562120.1 hypothetical protein [Gemmobacter sp.]
MWRSAALILCLGLAGGTLTACQMALPFGGGKAAPAAATSPAQATVTAQPGAIAGGVVTATPIGAKAAPSKAAAVAPAKGGAAIPAGTIKGTPQAAPPKPEAATPKSTKPDSAKPDAAKPDAEAEAEPAPPKSAPQLACEASGGLWSEAGKKGVKTCVQRTRDAGKSCKREGDCEGYCLARSRSCAPVTPLFGCNDILQADGGQVTLCID